ncbi:MAG TPA: OsmC family protein [Armatimonadota bacterium]|jgi:peroxiredoxin-like protein
MADEKHVFHVHSVWNGDSDGDGDLRMEDREMIYGRPHQLGGAPGRTNPEEMLVQAVAACYSITLAVIAERKRLPITKIEVAAEGDVVRQPNKSLKFTAIRLKPVLTVDSADEGVRQKALDTAHHAENYCLISQALDSELKITLEPSIV